MKSKDNGPSDALDESIKQCKGGALDEYNRACIAGKIIAGEKLSQTQREKVYEWITGSAYEAPVKKKRGRPKLSLEDETLEINQLYIDLRPLHKNDKETFRAIHRELKLKPKDFEDCYSRIWHAVNDNKASIEELDRKFWDEFEACWGIAARIEEERKSKRKIENN